MKLLDAADVSTLLSTYVTLLGLSAEDTRSVDLSRSLTMASSAILLAGGEGTALWALSPAEVPIRELTLGALLLVICWPVFTAIAAKLEKREFLMALNLNVALFWLAVAVFFIAVAFTIFPEERKGPERVVLVAILLFFSVTIYVLRSRITVTRKVLYWPALLFTNGALAVWVVI